MPSEFQLDIVADDDPDLLTIREVVPERNFGAGAIGGGSGAAEMVGVEREHPVESPVPGMGSWELT